MDEDLWEAIPAYKLGKFDGTGMVAYACRMHPEYVTGVGRPDSHRLNEARSQHERAKHTTEEKQ